MSEAEGIWINLSRSPLEGVSLGDNLNLTLEDGGDSVEEKNYWALLLLLLCVVVVFGNVLVILSVVKVSTAFPQSP